MQKQTLKFPTLIHMAKFSKVVSVGYLMNTVNCTLTGKFPQEDVHLAQSEYQATVIETTEKVFSYHA